MNVAYTATSRLVVVQAVVPRSYSKKHVCTSLNSVDDAALAAVPRSVDRGGFADSLASIKFPPQQGNPTATRSHLAFRFPRRSGPLRPPPIVADIPFSIDARFSQACSLHN